jgi:hypothetical protein
MRAGPAFGVAFGVAFDVAFYIALAGLPAAVTDGSILVPRLKRQFTNSDAFFAFSAIQVRFGQVQVTAHDMAHDRAKRLFNS